MIPSFSKNPKADLQRLFIRLGAHQVISIDLSLLFQASEGVPWKIPTRWTCSCIEKTEERCTWEVEVENKSWTVPETHIMRSVIRATLLVFTFSAKEESQVASHHREQKGRKRGVTWEIPELTADVDLEYTDNRLRSCISRIEWTNLKSSFETTKLLYPAPGA